MSSPFTDREREIFAAAYDVGMTECYFEKARNARSLEEWDAALEAAGLTPEPRETETELDAKRFAHYLVGNRAFRDNSIIKMEMRAVSGDDPTLDEWRAAIDKSILAAAKDKELVD